MRHNGIVIRQQGQRFRSKDAEVARARLRTRFTALGLSKSSLESKDFEARRCEALFRLVSAFLQFQKLFLIRGLLHLVHGCERVDIQAGCCVILKNIKTFAFEYSKHDLGRYHMLVMLKFMKY